jgi:ABC-type sugar transport system ATPase subunit
MDPEGDLWVQLDSLGVNIDTLADTSLKNLSSSLGGIKEGTITAGDALKQLSTTTVTVTEKTSKAASMLKALGSVGKVALSTLGTMAAVYAASAALEFIGTKIYEIVNASEIAIQKGEEARQKISDINDAYNEKKTFNDTNAERFGELRERVDPSTNKNISLTNDEYSEYLSLCNEIAGIYPQLVTSYDAQGKWDGRFLCIR